MNSLKTDRGLWVTGLTSVLLLAIMNIYHGPLFTKLTKGCKIPDTDFWATPETLMSLRQSLMNLTDAAVTLRNMHLYADMVLPAVLTAFLFLLIRRLANGAEIYRRPAEQLLGILLSLPLLYGFFDYTENILSLMLFPPAAPDDALAETLATALHWATRLKFMFVAISLIMAGRLAIAHTIPLGGTRND